MIVNWAGMGIGLAAAVVSATLVLAVSAAPAEIFDVMYAPHVAANIGNVARAVLDVIDKVARGADNLHDGVEKAWNMMATRFSPFMICGPITFLYHEVRVPSENTRTHTCYACSNTHAVAVRTCACVLHR